MSDEDEYMGTVSLNYIEDRSAELSIVVRNCAMSIEYAWLVLRSSDPCGYNDTVIMLCYFLVSRIELLKIPLVGM